MPKQVKCQPTTDAEVEVFCLALPDPKLSQAAYAIYMTYRTEGMSVADAYAAMYTLVIETMMRNLGKGLDA